MVRNLPAYMPRLMMTFAATLALVFAAALPVFAQSTPEPGAGPSTPSVMPTEDQAVFAFVQASSSLVAVDVMVDDQPVLTNVAFGDVSDFLIVDSGDHNVKLVPAGGDVSQALTDSDLTMDGGKVYDLVAAGPTDEVEVKSFEFNNDPVTGENARIRIIHAADTVDAIDVAPVDGDPIVSDLSYFNASDHTDYRAGEVQFEVRATGEQGSLVTLPTFNAEAGSSLDIIVTTDAQANPVGLILGAFPGVELTDDEVATPAT